MLDAVTARAVSALRTLVPLTAPLVRDGGELILLKGANAVERDRGRREAAAQVPGDERAASRSSARVCCDEPTRVVRATVR